MLGVSGLPQGSYTFYFGVDLLQNGELDRNELTFDSIVVDISLAVPVSNTSCGTETALFTQAPLQSDAYFEIDPLGATNPSAHTFPTVHTYMMLTDISVPEPVSAPGEITITQVNLVNNLSIDAFDYSINFTVCPEVTGYFDHMSSMEEGLLQQVGVIDDCREYTAGSDLYRL